MSNQPLGNEEAMEKVREMMAAQGVNQVAEEVNQGDKMKNTIEVDFVDDFGEHFTGTIVLKRPNLQDNMRMGSLKAQYLGMHGNVNPALLDNGVLYTAQVMATLKVVIVKAPMWLINPATNLIDLNIVYDVELLHHIYDKYVEWENSFRKPRAETFATDSEDAEGEENVATS